MYVYVCRWGGVYICMYVSIHVIFYIFRSHTHIHTYIFLKTTGSINSMIKLGEVLSDLGRAEEGLMMLDQAVQRTDMR
jgi:hypothetical protein